MTRWIDKAAAEGGTARPGAPRVHYLAHRRNIGRALDLATQMLAMHEPGDSRAVSEEFVAIAAVQSGCEDKACMEVIERALGRMEEAHRRGEPMVRLPEVTIEVEVGGNAEDEPDVAEVRPAP